MAASASRDHQHCREPKGSPVGSTVTITGTVKDQFGGLYQPTVAEGRNVTLAFAVAALPATAPLTGGMFSYVYTPAVTPTAGTTTGVTINYDPPARRCPLSPRRPPAITWLSATAAGSIDLSTDRCYAGVQDAATTPATGDVANHGYRLRRVECGAAEQGRHLDGRQRCVLHRRHHAVRSGPVGHDHHGGVRRGGAITAYAHFTKAGAVTITATSGAATDTVAEVADCCHAGL